MKKFKGIIILKPDIPENQIDFIQSDIINTIEEKCKVQKVWYLGKKQLNTKIKKYKEGIFLKTELLAKSNKIDGIIERLKRNKSVIFSIIINDEEKQTNTSKIPTLFNKEKSFNQLNNTTYNKKVYMLVSKNFNLPFTEANILAIMESKDKIFKEANEKIKHYIYSTKYCTAKNFENIKNVEKELKRTWKVEFVRKQIPYLKEELSIKEQILI